MTKVRGLLQLATKSFFSYKNTVPVQPTTAENNNLKPDYPPSPRNKFNTTPIAIQYIHNSINTSNYFFKCNSLAKDNKNQILAPFSCQAVLEEIAEKLNLDDKQPFKNAMVVAVQHILGTTVEMFTVLKKLGLERAIIGGKSYSTNKDSVQDLKNLGYTLIEAPYQLGYGQYDSCMQETVRNIWSTALKSMQENPAELLIILDDGGDLILSTPGKLFNGIAYKPKRVVGIEQTRGGSNHRWFNGVPFPVINVAGSYIKTSIEYPEVANIVASKVIKEVQEKAEAEFIKKPIIGVVGNGTMGNAIISKFKKEGYRVLVHDKMNMTNDKKATWRSNIPSLISDSDIIIGCTGTDITADIHTLNTILSSINPKCFVSTSSKDIEFNSLLVYIQEQTKQLDETPNPLKDIEFNNPEDSDSAKITILRGGFPINFDNQKHSVPPEKIWPTRAALMSACLMAVQAHNKKLFKAANVLKLDVYAQQLIIEKYQVMNPDAPSIDKTQGLANGELNEFILKNSDGSELNVFSDHNEAYKQEVSSIHSRL